MTSAVVRERAFTFACGDAELVGVVHSPESPDRRGILIIVGGPQYRAGSHRQFLLLARYLAAEGHAVMRFDHRGVGDSDDPYLGFEALDDDIAAAIDAFQAHCPKVKEVVLWGLCDAASAILFYAHRDPRITGIVLLNPWVRTPESEARTYLRHYYLQRLADPAVWRQLLSGRIQVRASLASFVELLSQRFGNRRRPRTTDGAHGGNQGRDNRPLPERMAEGLGRYRGPVLLIMSGQDLTAREFEDSARASDTWRRLLQEERVRRIDFEAADHTFSRGEWRDKVHKWTSDWIRSW